jgi:hypothetical protein
VLCYPIVAKVEDAAPVKRLRISQGRHIRGVKGEAVALYCEPLTTKEMLCPRLSRRINNTAILRALLELTNSDVLKCLLKIALTINHKSF